MTTATERIARREAGPCKSDLRVARETAMIHRDAMRLRGVKGAQVTIWINLETGNVEYFVVPKPIIVEQLRRAITDSCMVIEIIK